MDLLQSRSWSSVENVLPNLARSVAFTVCKFYRALFRETFGAINRTQTDASAKSWASRI